MIRFIASADNLVPMRRYLKDWAGPVAARVQVLTYEELPDVRGLPDGAYIFSDTERLRPEMEGRAVALWEALAQRGGRVRLLNRPDRVMRRAPLLKELHARGLNGFNVRFYREDPAGLRYPVFLRSATEHSGALSPLLEDERQLRAAGDAMLGSGFDPTELLVVEFIDAGEDGWYRKWSVMRIGDRYIAHHFMALREWMAKVPAVKNEKWIERQDDDFRRNNPHAKLVRPYFELANIDYGRIDYTIIDGRIQVWEINTNPTILFPIPRYTKKQIPLRRYFARNINRALLRLDWISPESRRLSGRWRWIKDWKSIEDKTPD